MSSVDFRGSRFEASARGFSSFLVLFTLTLAFAPYHVECQSSLAERMKVISEDLDRQLKDIMASQAVNYTTVNTTGLPYNATTKYYPRGMRQLYNITNMFIDFVQSKQAYPEGMLTIVNREPKLADPLKEWKIIVTHYGGLAGLALIGLLVAAILPCVGLFFCCCRCAGHCGARTQPFDKKHDHCRKVMLSFVLIAVATIILFGVVCAFVTNEYMQNGTRELPDNAKTSLKDVSLYLTTTKREINNVLKTNFAELEITLDNILQASGKIVTEQLAEYSHAVSLTNLNDFVTGLTSIKEDLNTMNSFTQTLRRNASLLDDVVRGVKSNLLHTLEDCTAHNCKEILRDYNVNRMAVQVEFDKLPNLTLALQNINASLEGNIVSEVRQGRDSFLKIQKDIQHAVNQTIPVVSASIRRAGDFLGSLSNNLTSLIDRINVDIDKVYIRHLDVARKHINQYAPYRYYVGLGVSGILLTVLMCLTFGLFCGVCGKRPDGYGDDCCNKGSGARFLMMAVWIIFLLTSILMVVTIAHMITGVIAQRGICEPLKNPQDNRMFKLVDDFVQIRRILYPRHPDANINMSYIVTQCHANETLYNVLKLKNLFDVDTLREYAGRYDINNTIQQLRRKISLSPGVEILKESARRKLLDLAQSGLSDIKFYQYADLLAENITNINLDHLASKLREVSAKLPNNQHNIKSRLESNAEILENVHKELALPMSRDIVIVAEKALTLQETIKFNHSSMAKAIHNLVEEVSNAQDFLNKDGPEYVQHLATRFGNAFLRQVDDFLERVIDNAHNNVGRCAPVSNAYNATLVASCNKILDPFNGFWVSVGWCLVLFIPTIVLCVKLSALYQKSDPYPGPLVEAVHDKKYHVSYGRHHPSAYVESYDGPAVGYERERIPDAHQSTSHHDSRYSDVAPKRRRAAQSLVPESNQNWDFPNGGPPRYQPAAGAPPPLSTEYERPPPYYYPGPGDRN